MVSWMELCPALSNNDISRDDCFIYVYSKNVRNAPLRKTRLEVNYLRISLHRVASQESHHDYGQCLRRVLWQYEQNQGL